MSSTVHNVKDKVKKLQQEISNILEMGIQETIFPGSVVGVITAHGEQLIQASGHFTYDKGAKVVEETTMYDMASVTKSIPGSSALLYLIDRGLVNLDDRLTDYIPEFGTSPDKEDVLIKHVLTYTVDLDSTSLAALKNFGPDEIVGTIMNARLKSVPGTVFSYTNATALFFSLIIERVTRKKLDVFAGEIFFKPLGMNRTTFNPELFDLSTITPTEVDEWRGRTVQGEVHDESTFVLKQKYTTAAAGLFSCVPDMLKFLEMMLCKGKKDGIRYFSEAILEEMHTVQFPGQDYAGLGWMLNWPQAMGTHCSASTFCKSGFTGTFVAVDPKKKVAFVHLSNRTYPKRPEGSLGVLSVRRQLSDAIFSQF